MTCDHGATGWTAADTPSCALQAQALNFYRTWPDEVLADPLAQCVANVNAAGELLTAEQREAVMEELPKAMPKIGLLLSTLAHAN